MGQVFGGSLHKILVFIASLAACLAILTFLRSDCKAGYVGYIQSRTDVIVETEDAENDLVAGEASLCKDKTEHFAMIKIGKAGTTTLLGILARFALSHRLNILSPRTGAHISWTGENDGKGTWVIGPEAVERADVLLNHAKYNKSIFNKYMKTDYKLIVPVREPVSWMRSAVKYYAHLANIKEKTPDAIIGDNNLLLKERPERYSGLNTWFHLPQLQWLGFDYDKRNDLAEIQTFITDLVPRIDIPILNDQYDASLLIMKKRFCWDYTDIFYMSRNVRRSSRLSISPKSVEKLLSLEVNLGDKLLYEAVNKTWWHQAELKEKDFWKEVTYFSRLNKKVTSQICPAVLKSNTQQTVESTDYHQVLSITSSLCKQLNDVEVHCAMKYVKQTPCKT